MKVLFIGTEFFDYPKAMEAAICKLGHEVVSYVLKDCSDQSFIQKVKSKLWFMKHRISEELWFPEKHVWEEQSRKVYELYQSFQPKLVIGFAAYILTSDVLEKMNGCKKILWIYDAIHNLSRIKENLKYYDQVYTFEKTDIPKLKELTSNVCFLPICADGRYYYPLAREKEYDLCFIGALSTQRRQMIRDIKKRFPDKKIIAYGKYLGRYDLFGHFARCLNGDKDVFTNRNIGQKESNELYAKSKICLNIHKKQTKYGGNMRLFELMAAGAFQIVDENEYIREEFAGCLETYQDFNELCSKLDYYWKNEDKREAIAKRGFEKVTGHHMFIHRVRFIFERI